MGAADRGRVRPVRVAVEAYERAAHGRRDARLPRRARRARGAHGARLRAQRLRNLDPRVDGPGVRVRRGVPGHAGLGS